MGSGKRANIIIAVIFGGAITICAYPLLAPFAELALAGAEPSSYLDVLSGVEPISQWTRFWVSSLWVRHLPCMLAMLAILSLVMLAYLAVQDVREKRVVSNGIYGEARIISSARELKEKNDFWDGRGTPKSAGMVLGATRRGHYYDSAVPHCLVVGKTGSGKATCSVSRQCICFSRPDGMCCAQARRRCLS